jgi:glucokinase
VVRGSRNISFEIGHIPYKEAPFRCGCGRDNCLELYASGSGLKKWMEHYGLFGEPDLEELKHSGNAASRIIAEAFDEALLHAAGVLITLANPEIMVLGGGVIGHNRYLDTLLRERLPSYTLKNSLEPLRIERSVLENAPLEGAKLLEIPHG